MAGACSGSKAPQIPKQPASPTAAQTLASTGSDEPARRDLIDLARRLGGRPDPAPRASPTPPVPGADATFELLILPDAPEARPVRKTATATLRAVSEHAYFFVESGVALDGGELDAAVDAFENHVWPVVTGAFGLPPIPGVDGDPKVAILHADLGSAVGAYVSDDDAYPRTVAPASNEREMVYMNLSQRPFGSPGYTRVLAHELQHLIHRRLDADEAAWVNEGLSEVAGGLVSESPRSYGSFLDHPDTQLNSWAVGSEGGAHYGASGLFFAYLLEQTDLGVGELAAEPAGGIDGVRAFLEEARSSRSFSELVGDWAVANYLDEPEGPYGYHGREVSAPTAEVVDVPGASEGDVRQFGADYLELTSEAFESGVAFDFQGDAEVPVLAAQVDADADGPIWWSGRGDEMDATLTRELDLTNVASATLTFRTWFDIERWFDYGYVTLSRDDGRTWEALAGVATSIDDPLAISYGPAYTGRSGGAEVPAWVEERIDLSAYAGSRVLLRFEYVTDGGLNEAGWAIDDIAVPEIGFFDDAQEDVGGWRREGFRRLAETLPQRFELRLITFGPTPAVEEIELDAQNHAALDLSGLGTEYSRAIVVIVGATEGTTEPARYRYEFSAAPPDNEPGTEGGT